jgi:ABC-type phosphate/phosphonate transport system ATPase subunit
MSLFIEHIHSPWTVQAKQKQMWMAQGEKGDRCIKRRLGDTQRRCFMVPTSNIIRWVVLTDPHAEKPSMINLFGLVMRQMKDMILCSLENMNLSTMLTQKSPCSILD